MDIWHIPGQIIYEFLSLIAIPLTTNSRSPYYLPSCKKHRIIYKFYFSHPTLRMLCKKQIPRISNKHPTINDIDKEYNWLNEEYIYIYLNPFSSSLITNISRPSKLLISRPDNVHTLWNTTLSLPFSFHITNGERGDGLGTRAQFERRNLRRPRREREIEMHKSNRSWRFMARYG